jgi:hypothetical protein
MWLRQRGAPKKPSYMDQYVPVSRVAGRPGESFISPDPDAH